MLSEIADWWKKLIERVKGEAESGIFYVVGHQNIYSGIDRASPPTISYYAGAQIDKTIYTISVYERDMDAALKVMQNIV